jgi:hypothetical protein
MDNNNCLLESESRMTPIPRGKLICVGLIAGGIIAILFQWTGLGMAMLIGGLIGVSFLYPNTGVT